MADELRFWEAGAAGRDDAPQAQLKAVLLLLEEPEPAWGSIDAILHELRDGDPNWKRWQRMLTALHVRAGKAVHAARVAGELAAVDDGAAAEMRAAGWELFPELTGRLTRMWGAGPRFEEVPGRMRITWARTHEGGRQAGQPVRCQIDVHPNNPGWMRVRWASWREGMRAPAGTKPTTAQVLGIDADEAFAPRPGERGGPVPVSQGVVEAVTAWTDEKAGGG